MKLPYCAEVRAWPPLPVTGVYRSQPADFRVDEQLQPRDEDAGEHLWLRLEKTGQNTAWVGRQLARWAGVSPQAVGWAGLKDRHAVTRQWFSIHLPGQSAPAFETLEMEGVRLLEHRRQRNKLRPGMHAGNAFVLRLRQVQGPRQRLEERLKLLTERGFANGFGPQRFGLRGNNVTALAAWLERGGRGRGSGRLISTGRAILFNRMLQRAIESGQWPQGEGWLWGRFHRDHEAGALEQAVREEYPLLCRWLEGLGMNAQARPLRVRPQGLCWHWPRKDELELRFCLPAGSFATAMLLELGRWRDVSSGTSVVQDSPTESTNSEASP